MSLIPCGQTLPARIGQVERVVAHVCVAHVCVDSSRRRASAMPGAVFLSVFSGLQPDSADMAHAPPEIFPAAHPGPARVSRASGISRWRALRQARRNGSGAGSILTRAEHPQHANVTSGLVTAGVGDDLVKRAIAAGAGQFAHTRMLADRIEARVLPQPPKIGTDRHQPSPSRGPRAGLCQPAPGGIKVIARPRGVDQPSRHPFDQR